MAIGYIIGLKKGLLYYFVSFLKSLYGMVNSTAHICIHDK